MLDAKDKDFWDELEVNFYIGAWFLFIIFVLITVIMVVLRKTILPI